MTDADITKVRERRCFLRSLFDIGIGALVGAGFVVWAVVAYFDGCISVQLERSTATVCYRKAAT